MPSRRTVLAGLAGAGAGGIATYSRRYRLLRFPDRRELRSIRDVEPPAVPDPIFIPESYLVDLRSAVGESIDRARDFGVPDESGVHPTTYTARSWLETAEERDGRVGTAIALQLALVSAVHAASAVELAEDRLDTADLEAAFEAVIDRLRALAREYDHESPTTTVARYHAVEIGVQEIREWIRRVEDADYDPFERTPQQTAGYVTLSNTRPDLMEALLADAAGDSKEAVLREVSERLGREYASRLESADTAPSTVVRLRSSGSPRVYAGTAGHTALLSGDRRDHADASRLASAVVAAVRDLALLRVVETAPDEAVSPWTADSSPSVDAEAVRTAKRGAIASIDAVESNYRDDALGGLLLAVGGEAIAEADSGLERALSRPDAPPDRWNRYLSRADVGYRFASELVTAAPLAIGQLSD